MARTAEMMSIPRPFTIAGLADRWQVAPGTIYAMIRRGELKAFRAGKSPLRIAAIEVERHESGMACGDLNSIGEHGARSAELTGRPSEYPYGPKIVRLPPNR